MKVVGIDLSLSSTGVAVLWTGGGVGAVAQVDRIQTRLTGDTVTARWKRLRDIVNEAAAWVTAADLVVVEGLAYASRSPHATERAGLWWLVVNRLMAYEHDVAVVPPTSRAKYATGRGNAGKDQVLAAVVRRYPEVEVTGNDEADALVLAAMGARSIGHPIERALPRAHVDAMAKVVWPADTSP